MKWLIAVCVVLIALGVFVEPKKIKISGDNIVPITRDAKPGSLATIVGGGGTIVSTGTNTIGSLSAVSGPTWTTVERKTFVQCLEDDTQSVSRCMSNRP